MHSMYRIKTVDIISIRFLSMENSLSLAFNAEIQVQLSTQTASFVSKNQTNTPKSHIANTNEMNYLLEEKQQTIRRSFNVLLNATVQSQLIYGRAHQSEKKIHGIPMFPLHTISCHSFVHLICAHCVCVLSGWCLCVLFRIVISSVS